MKDYIKNAIDQFAQFSNEMANSENFEHHQELLEQIDEIDKMSFRAGCERQELMKYCFNVFASVLDKSELCSHVRNKPYGYAGDFEIIDWIYTKKKCNNGKGHFWDIVFQNQPACEAVRNRKEFLIELFVSMYDAKKQEISVLDIASGSGRPILEAVVRAMSDENKTYIHCIDHELNAIQYSKRLKTELAPSYDFLFDNRNVFRLRPEKKYDLVWSGGLFEYLNDRLAVGLLQRMWNWTNSGGKISFGAFHPSNPSRSWMEWCGEWFLIHRTEEDILSLCKLAGISSGRVSFKYESLGVNLFTIIEKD